MQASPSSNARPGRTLLHSLFSCSEGGQLRRCRSQNAWFSAMTGCDSTGLGGVGEAVQWATDDNWSGRCSHGSMPAVSSKALKAQGELVIGFPACTASRSLNSWYPVVLNCDGRGGCANMPCLLRDRKPAGAAAA